MNEQERILAGFVFYIPFHLAIPTRTSATRAMIKGSPRSFQQEPCFASTHHPFITLTNHQRQPRIQTPSMSFFHDILALAFPTRSESANSVSIGGRIEVVEFPAPRIPHDPNATCGCGSGSKYAVCCRPFHTYERIERSALEVIRARFCAYKFKIVKYIMTSCSPNSELTRQAPRKWSRDIAEFCDDYQFINMEVLSTRVAGPRETSVIFKCNLLYQGLPVNFTERSKFVEIRGRWYYDNGSLFDIDGGDAF